MEVAWEPGTYKRTAALAIVGEIQEILRRSSLPSLASMQVVGAQVLCSGDLDVRSGAPTLE
jgi:hypothetical protein